MEKNDKERVVPFGDVQQFEAMLNEFKEAIDNVNEKYSRIAEFFSRNFVNRLPSVEYDNSLKEKSVKSFSEKKVKGKSKGEKDSTQKSILASGFGSQVKEADNASHISSSFKAERNAIDPPMSTHEDEKSGSSSRQLKEGTVKEVPNKKKKIASDEIAKSEKENKGNEPDIIINKKEESKSTEIEKPSEKGNDDNSSNPNFDQQFFNYKAFNPPVNQLKRKSSSSKEEGDAKREKKVNKNWITKETTNQIQKIVELKDEEDMNTTNNKAYKSRSDFSDEDISNSITYSNKHSNNLSELKSLIDTNMKPNHISSKNSVNSAKANQDKANSNKKSANSSVEGNSLKPINTLPQDEQISKAPPKPKEALIAPNNANSKSKSNTIINSQSKSESSQASLEFSSRIQSKDKNYNFDNQIQPKEEQKQSTKFNEYLQLKKANQRIQQRNSLIDKINTSMTSLEKQNKKEPQIDKTKDKSGNANADVFAVPENKIYNLELKTFEDTAYDEFYKLKHNNKGNNRRSMALNNKSVKPKNMNLLTGGNVPRNKKEREMMQGFKCDLCENFYEIFDERQTGSLCNECSRHRAHDKPNSTPKGFYDLSF